MKNWKKGMIAGSIICIATGFLFIGIGSSMGGWKNIDKINSRYIHFGGSDTFIGLNFQPNTKESIQILSRGTDGPADVGSTSTGEVISFNGKLPEEMEISANTLALKIVPGKSDAIILSRPADLDCAAAICPSFCRFGGVFDGGYGQRWRAPSVDCVDGVPGECAPSGVRSFIPVAQCEGFLG